MEASVATGIFTLGGVAVGGLLNYVVTAAIEERRGRRALRTTSRVVGEELRTNLAELEAAIEGGMWLAGRARYQFTAWEHYRHVLAERLEDPDWQLLRDAISGIRLMEGRRTSGEHDDALGPAESGPLQEISAAARRAVDMLDRHS